jgi:hypothetical protein
VKRLVLIILGCAVGLLFFYLAFRGVSWNEFVAGLAGMQPVYLIPASLMVVLAQLIRALRFRLIVSPFFRLSIVDMWHVINIWGGLNMVMPVRLAEFVRPYLLQQRGAPFSSTLAGVMVERIFDLLGLLTLLSVVLWQTPQLSAAYSHVGKALLLIAAGGYVFVLLSVWLRSQLDRLANRVIHKLPARVADPLAGIVHRIIDGFTIMASPLQAVVIFVYSVAIWTVFSFNTYIFLHAFAVDVPLLAAVTTQVFLCLGVAIPSAPGFIGTFHAAGRYALEIFGVHTVLAISFATVYHLFSITISVLMALFSYSVSNYRFSYGLAVRDHPEFTDPGDPVRAAREAVDS